MKTKNNTAAPQKKTTTLSSGERNNNVIMFGGPDTGTIDAVCREILSCGASMVISDTGGRLFDECKEPLEEMGYDVFLLDSAHPERSDQYNILKNINTPADAEKFSDMIVYQMNKRDTGGDKLWPQSEAMFLNANLGYLMEGGKGIKKDMGGLGDLIKLYDAEAMENKKPCDATRVFEHHRDCCKKLTGEDSWAYEQQKKFIGISSRMFGSVLMSTLANLSPFDTEEMRTMLSDSDLDIRSAAHKKTAIFVISSDTDRSKDIVIDIILTQMMSELCSYADSLQGKRLPVPVRFIMNDFGTAARIDGFETMISNICRRGISAMLILQSLSPLEQSYRTGNKTILANCAIKIYMGGSDPDTAAYFSTLANKPLERILNMPLMTYYLIRQGEQPVFGKNALTGNPIYHRTQLPIRKDGSL